MVDARFSGRSTSAFPVDAEAYKQRNLVERRFGKLKQWRAIATRFDKLASRHLAGVTIGCLMPWHGMAR
ncbi:Transposase DDE domain-containing protein [Microbispora rosea]|uniref:Transposase DDE domain-containing protein n=1 Tax=Microbispora rosea TaxID=58117 RepID=A0A1N7ER34_9ACTN|nr:transposase [Microbispora rosea]GIH50546.1 hypothetical protein Mro03_57250 [Microbispora rosea subsp. rosea]SIR90561.1 Transposase DDE domain-containing protein [Microbispora rosea]